jgi:type IV secretory pathway VirB10-like protein
VADGLPPRPDADDDGMDESPRPQPGTEPPPLDAIRIKGRGAKGLNKPAIMIAAGGGLAVVLVLASGALTSDPSRKPAETKPMMSDPARPEMAQGALRQLPADYQQAAILQERQQPAAPPLLGPPLPGDVAAFAPQEPDYRDQNPDDWSAGPGHAGDDAVDPAIAEALQADRSQLFFAVRETTKATESPSHQLQPPPSRSPLTALGRQADAPQPTTAANDRALFPGAVISASLVTELNSESPGPVIAQVTQGVFDSATGRTLLIPQGARLIGAYQSSTRYGQSRVAILWSRLIMPDGEEIALDEAATGPSGAAGVKGKVDNHWGDVFGAAALGTLINIGVATTEDPQLTYGGIGAVTRDPVDAAIADGVQRSASTVTNRVVDRGLAIPPTIRVPAGTRVGVIVTQRTTF